MMGKAQEKKVFRNRIVEHGVMPAQQFLANPLNARRHPVPQREAMRGILDEVGFVQGVVVSARSGVLLDGHLRLEEALSRDEDSPIPFVKVDVSESEEKLILASFDPLTALATYDKEILDSLLHEVSTGDAAVSQMLSDLAENNGLYFGEKKEEETNPAELVDRAKELQEKWQTATGQLWEIPSKSASGQSHRLLIGDCTEKSNVEHLCGENRLSLMNTDPPYGVDYVAIKDGIPVSGMRDLRARHGDITNDDLTDGAQLQDFLECAIRAAVPHLIDNPAFYLWHPMLTQGTFFAAAAAANILIHRQIIWVKPSLVLTRSGQYHWKHELCFYGWIKGKPCAWHGDKSQTSVWEVGREGGLHPTQKPVELFKRPIENHTLKGEIVYEPFAGSGSQFVAAEETGRLCYGLEIEPRYAATILERMSLLGLTPKLIEPLTN